MEIEQITLENEFSIESKIINFLNDFGENVVNNYSPLIITKDDFFTLFELTKEQLLQVILDV